MDADKKSPDGRPPGNGGATVLADRRLRRTMVWVLLAVAVAGGVAVYLITTRLAAVEALADTDVDRAVAEIRRLLWGLILANFLVTAGFAVYFFRLGRRVLRAGRYPPPEMKVLRRTRIRTGKAAVWIGRAMVLFALVLLSTNILLVQLHRMLDRLSGGL